MESATDAIFQKNYQRHLQHLKLKGLQPKTVDAYSRAIRRIGEHFNGCIDDLSEQQLTDYFTELVGSRSWSTVKLDLHGLKFYYAHVLRKPCWWGQSPAGAAGGVSPGKPTNAHLRELTRPVSADPAGLLTSASKPEEGSVPGAITSS